MQTDGVTNLLHLIIYACVTNSTHLILIIYFDLVDEMVSLELWYYTAVLILVGLLKDAKLQVDVMSVWYVTNFTNSLL
jgi:hypothetical protein